MTYTAYITLLALWEQDNVTVRELGDKLYLDSGTLTPLLKKLEADGLLVRTRNKQDERTVTITLTDAGLALKKNAVNVPNDLICAITNSKKQTTVDMVRLLNDLHELMNLLK